MVKSLLSRMKALHEDQQGATMIEYALVFAAVALPLLGVLIYFWKDISRWAGDVWEDIKGGGVETNPDSL